MSFGAKIKAIGALWDQMTEEQKRPYVEKGARNIAAYNEEMERRGLR